MKRLVLFSIVVTTLPFAIATADRRGGPPRPPQPAYDACAKSARGDACTVTFQDHSLAGTCELVPDTTSLACQPKRPPGPPPEAIEACANAKEGDACTMTHRDHSISGTCARDHGPLACRPPVPPK